MPYFKYVTNINSFNPFKTHSINRDWWLLKPTEDMDPNVSPASIQKESGPASHSSRVSLGKGCKANPAAVPQEHCLPGEQTHCYIPCTDWTNLCSLQRNPVFSFTNRKSLMLGFYFKHALKLWVFSRKNESLPITLTCYSTNGTNSGDKSEHVWAELLKKTLDQPSKILFYRVRAYATFCSTGSY
jgi:hypothetical protein